MQKREKKRRKPSPRVMIHEQCRRKPKKKTRTNKYIYIHYELIFFTYIIPSIHPLRPSLLDLYEQPPYSRTQPDIGLHVLLLFYAHLEPVYVSKKPYFAEPPVRCGEARELVVRAADACWADFDGEVCGRAPED